MLRSLWRSFASGLALFVVLAASAAQPAGNAPAPRAVQVHYVDGSVVFMKLLDEHIEIQTDYGKLTVPPAQIRSITFGFHVDAEVAEKVESLVRQLASGDFPKRELAFKALVQLGHQAYPILAQHQKDKDQEVATRAAKAMQAIEQKVPQSLLQRKSEDTIHTAKFTIVGKILTPALRAESEYFGEQKLKPSQLVAIGLPGNVASSGEIMVDSAKYGSAHNQWLATGIQVRAGQALKITATGQIDLVPPQAGKYMSGPYGWQNAGKNNLNQEGTLQGRISPNGPTFLVGESYQGQADRDGELFLHIVPCIWGNASTGSFQVKVTLP